MNVPCVQIAPNSTLHVPQQNTHQVWSRSDMRRADTGTEIPCFIVRYGIQTFVCQRELEIMQRERWICSIMQKRYNAIHHFPDEILAWLVWQCKVFLLTHQRRILGSVRKLLGWSTMAACTESWGLNKNESGAVWMPAEWLRRCDLIWSVNPWTAHSCQYSALVWSSVYEPITATSPSTPKAWTQFQQKWWLWPSSKHTALWTLKAIH